MIGNQLNDSAQLGVFNLLVVGDRPYTVPQMDVVGRFEWTNSRRQLIQASAALNLASWHRGGSLLAKSRPQKSLG